MPDQLPVHLIGMQAFLPALLAYIRNVASSPSLPLDHVIFQSVLLCLIAGDKHLIIRTPEEDVGLTVKLVVWTLTSIFNLSTHKLKIRNRSNFKSSSDPAAFLRSLFLPYGSSSSNSNHTSQDEGSGENMKHFGHHRQHAHSRSTKHKSRHREYSRSRSFPNSLASAVQTHGTTIASPDSFLMQAIIPDPDPSTASNLHAPAAPSILKPQPIYPQGSSGLSHSHTDPLPIPDQRRKSASQSVKPLLQLPQALVISGIENATDGTQRSLSQVLAEKRVVLESQKDTASMEGNGSRFSRSLSGMDDEDGVWNLPEGFIAIYVCPWNAKERPAIHKSLLDKFAMSTNVFIPQNIRRDFYLLPFSPAPRPFHPNFFSHSNPGSPSPTHAMTLPPTHTPPIFTKSLPIHRRASAYSNPPLLPEEVLPNSFINALREARHRVHISYTLSLYLSDIFSATRHHSRLDAMLLTAQALKDAEDLICASRVIGNDLTGMELLRPPPIAAVAHGDGGSGSSLDSDSQRDRDSARSYQRLADQLEDDDDEHRSDAASASQSQQQQRERNDADDDDAMTRVLDVSEVHVARIVPRVVSHRVRLRDGPEDEVLSSALFGATFRPPIPATLPVKNAAAGEDAWNVGADQPQSVKAVLVQILSEV